MNEGEAIWVFIGPQGGFMHEAADGEMGHEHPEEILSNEVGGFAAQDDLCAAQMGFQFAEGLFLFRGKKLVFIDLSILFIR